MYNKLALNIVAQDYNEYLLFHRLCESGLQRQPTIIVPRAVSLGIIVKRPVIFKMAPTDVQKVKAGCWPKYSSIPQELSRLFP